MQFSEVRQKYPQYDDMSDEALAGALHKKYYSDMPYEDFSSKVGLIGPEPEPGIIDVAKDKAAELTAGVTTDDVLGALGAIPEKLKGGVQAAGELGTMAREEYEAPELDMISGAQPTVASMADVPAAAEKMGIQPTVLESLGLAGENFKGAIATVPSNILDFGISGGEAIADLLPEPNRDPDDPDRGILSDLYSASALGGEKLAENLRESFVTPALEYSEAATKEANQAAMKFPPGHPKRGLISGGGSAGHTVAALLGGPKNALKIMFGDVGGMETRKAKEVWDNPDAGILIKGLKSAGYDDAGAFVIGNLYGASEVAMEKMPLEILFRKWGKNWVKELTKFAVAESGQEGLTEGLQAGLDKITSDPNMTWGDFRDRYKDLLASLPVAIGGPAIAVKVPEIAVTKLEERATEADYNRRVDEALHNIAGMQVQDMLDPNRGGVAPEATTRKPTDVGPAASAATAVQEELAQAQQAYTKAEAGEAAEKLGGRASGAQQLTEQEARDEEARILGDRAIAEQKKQARAEADQAYNVLENLQFEKRKEEETEAELQKAQQDTAAQEEMQPYQKAVAPEPTAIEQAYTQALDEALVAELKAALPEQKKIEHRPTIHLPGPKKGPPKKITLTRYGKTPERTVADPAFHGKGIPGQESKRKKEDPLNWVDRSYFYTGAEPTHKDVMLGPHKFHAEVDEASLYDYTKDPDGLIAEAKEGLVTNVTKYEKLIKEAGYKGYRVNTKEQGEVVAMFEKTPIQLVPPKEEQPRVETERPGGATAEFFTKMTLGEGGIPNAQYQPVLTQVQEKTGFVDEYNKHRGNFDNHIRASIPGFGEVQVFVGDALIQTYGTGADVLDIGASEGSWAKTLSASTDGAINTTSLDPLQAMADFFNQEQVPGAEFKMEAFGDTGWTEPDGTEIKPFKPTKKYDVIHEAMTFQFIDNDRAGQFARAKGMLKPDGILLTEEKTRDDGSAEYKANEAKKDEYKAQYFTETAIKDKAKDTLVVGMNDNMVTQEQLEADLSEQFANVVQYWSSGNFKGYAASDSIESLESFLNNLEDTNSEYATERAPVWVRTSAPAGERRARTAEVKDDRRVGEDRRKDTLAREKVKEMSREELERHVLNHELTGVKGRFSFDIEHPNATSYVSVDADSLKWINDNMTPDNGDVLLQNVATALLNEFGYGRVYHISGDEFYVLGFDTADDPILQEGMARVSDRLKDVVLTVKKPDGTEIELTGVAATAGYGNSKAEADNVLKQEKAEKERRGERAARGDAPAGTVVNPPPGQQDTEGQVAADEGTTGEGQVGPGTEGPIDPGTLAANPLGIMAKVWERMADNGIDMWNNAVGWRYDTLGKLPSKDLYLIERYKVLGRIADVDRIARDVYDTFRKATEADQRAVYDYLTTPEATPNIIEDAAVRTKAIATKRLINKTGQALVDRGLLSEAAFLKNQDGYLPRTYLKYLLGDSLIKQITGGKKVSKMSWARARQDIPKEVRDLILGEITDPAYLASKGLGTELRDIAIIDFLNWISQETDWVHTGSIVEWQDKTVSTVWLDQEAKRIERQAAYYKDGPRQKALTMVNEMRDVLADATPAGERPVDSKDYREVPVNKRYGRLQGMYIRKEIYDDLLSTGQIMPGDADFWENWFGYGGRGTKVTQLWKMSKVALNPPAQIRNAMSNMILLHLSGMPLAQVPRYVVKAIKEVRTNGRYWKLAKKHGVTESTFAAQELYRVERDLLDLESRLAGTWSMATLKNMAGIIGEYAGDTYQLIEALGKTARIMYGMRKEGLSADDAAMKAQKWLFDYSLVPSAVRTARNMPLGVPFITFYYKVLPRLLEAGIKRPWAYTPYVALPAMMAMLFAEVNDVDDEDAKQLTEAFPMWLQDKGNAFLWPHKDEAGRWQAIDFGYVLPWSMFMDAGTDVAKGDFADAVKASGVFGGPIPSLVTAIKTNTDPYTGREIVPAGANPKDQVMNILNYTYNLAMPTWVTEIGFAGKMLDAINEDVTTNEEMGRTVLTPGQATLRLFGANVYPFNPERSRGKNIEQMQKEIQDIRTHSRRKIRDIVNDVDGEDNEQRIMEVTDDMAARIQKISEEIQDYAEGSEVPDALTLDR